MNESNFARFDAKLDARFAQYDAKLDARFAQLDAKLDARFAEFGKELADLRVQFERGFSAQARFILLSWATFFAAVVALVLALK